MTYTLGVDLGTTYTAAAVARETGVPPGTVPAGPPSGLPAVEIVPLGDHEAAVPSVVRWPRDGDLLVGEPAERRAATSPEATAREFKRRLGDPTPVLLDGVPRAPHALMATVLRWVLDRVVEREGSPPVTVAVTYPANWGDYRRELLEQAIRHVGVEGAVLVSEPQAAALRYASTERVAQGDTVGVYDLGGGTFDAAVVRRTATGFELLGQPAGIEHLGGVDVDQAVFAHVQRALGPEAFDVDPDDLAVAAAVHQLRRDCVMAKEALSYDTEALIPVNLPGARTVVRLTRVELEELVRPLILETVTAFRRALSSAGIQAAELTSVLLAGGASRMPLVSQMLSSELGRAVALDAHPKHVVALGAALWGARGGQWPAADVADLEAVPAVPVGGAGAAPEGSGPDPAAPTAPPRRIPRPSRLRPGSARAGAPGVAAPNVTARGVTAPGGTAPGTVPGTAAGRGAAPGSGAGTGVAAPAGSAPGVAGPGSGGAGRTGRRAGGVPVGTPGPPSGSAPTAGAGGSAGAGGTGGAAGPAGAVPARVTARARELSRRPDAILGGVAALCLALLVVVCAVGLGGGPTANARLSNTPAGSSDDVDVTRPVFVMTIPPADRDQPVASPTVEGSIIGIGLPGSSPTPGRVAVGLGSWQYLVAGDLVVTVRYSALAGGELRPQERKAVLHGGNGLLTVPGIGGLGLLLFALAYAESLLRPVRRRQRTKASTLAGMALVGVAFGVALALVGWAVFPGHLLNARLLFAAALLGNAAALALTVLLSRRDPAPA